MKAPVMIYTSSGNVFEDLGRPCAAEKKLEARRAVREAAYLDIVEGMPLAVIKRNQELMEKRIPLTLGACADALYTLREQRLLVEKQAEAIKARETAIREHRSRRNRFPALKIGPRSTNTSSAPALLNSCSDVSPTMLLPSAGRLATKFLVSFRSTP